MEFSRAGWTKQTINVYFDHDQITLSGWVFQNTLGIGETPYDPKNPGNAKIALVVLMGKGYPLAAFETLDLAAQAAEIAEPLANWDYLMHDLRKSSEVYLRTPQTLDKAWDGYIKTDRRFNGLDVLSHR